MTSLKTIRFISVAVAVLALFASPLTLRAQTIPKDKPAPAPAAVVKPGNVADAADLEAFFDGAIRTQLESRHIAGAVVAIVADDKLIFSKGYGYADVEARRRVDPDKTLFRIASISKLFTWTAVMQLVEAGKIDLNTDINTYLKDLKIPATFKQPITMKHLLTHTPGFEDRIIGLFARKPEEVGPLVEMLKAHLPLRVRPPGLVASYSNHGTAIAGYAVASVSGAPWEDYVEQRILKPLGMTHTLVRQPAEDKLPADISKGYKWEGGRFVAKGFEYIPDAPAGCISTTADDAAKFMLAHLHDGQLGSEHILKPETARQMREPLYRPSEKTSAMCYGFMEMQRNGLRIVGHGGDTLWFHSLMELIPDKKVGFFVSFNTDSSAGVREVVFDAFMKRYFPGSEIPHVAATKDSHERIERVVGEYGSTRYSHSTVAKAAAFMETYRIKRNGDDTVTLSNGEFSRRYVEIEPYVFRELDGPGRLVFKEGDNGRIAYLLFANGPAAAAARREWYETSIAHGGLFGGCLAVFLSALFFWPAIAFSVRGLQSSYILRTRFSGLLSCLGWLLSLSAIASVSATAFALQEPTDVVFGLSPLLKQLLQTPQVLVVLSALTVLGCLIAWMKGYWRFTGRLHYTLVALAGIGLSWLIYYWNLLSFGFEGL
jgi:CubicO group peptidase (beta-lactamase class C family)